MIYRSAVGFGNWKQCHNCGATKHSGYYWLAGYKSKEEPPCPTTFEELEYKNWKDNAINDFEKLTA
jgi:hypothetical protein